MDVLEAVKKFGTNTEEWRQEKRSLWTHTTLVNATILGFSVAIAQNSSSPNTNLSLIISWVCLILDVLLGIILLKVDQDIKISTDIKTFEFNYNLTNIEGDYGVNKITKEQRDGMLLATFYQNGMDKALRNEGSQFSQFALDKINKYLNDLPSKHILKDAKPSKRSFVGQIFKTIDDHIKNYNQTYSDWFYYLKIFSYLFMFLSVIGRIKIIY